MRLPFPSRVLLLFCCLAAAAPASAASGRQASPASETLDAKKIHGHYNEGDFDQVLSALEGFMKRNRAYSHDDSVFIAKHLAVVYTANPATREKGKYYMNRLLDLLPSAKLVDMYVSEEIDRIFEKVREEYMTRQAYFTGETRPLPAAKPARTAASESGPASPAPAREGTGKKEGLSPAFWIAGGTGLVVAGLAGYFYFHGEPDPGPDRVYAVPESP